MSEKKLSQKRQVVDYNFQRLLLKNDFISYAHYGLAEPFKLNISDICELVAVKKQKALTYTKRKALTLVMLH